eukprot:171890-Pleurochrysis_carterae.AAC.1
MRTTTWRSMASTPCSRQIQTSPSPFKFGDTKFDTEFGMAKQKLIIPYLHTLKHRLLLRSKQECGNRVKILNLVWHDADILNQYLLFLSHLLFKFAKHLWETPVRCTATVVALRVAA